LLAHIGEQARARGADLLGASFGASQELLRFWKAVGCLPVRLGMTRDKASGLHSALVLGPLSEAGERLFARARARFLEHLPHQLGDPLRNLEPEIAGALMAGSSPARVADLSVADWLEIAACGFAHRGLEDSLLPIWRLACLALASGRDPAGMAEADHQLLILRVIQRWSWQETAQGLGLRGSDAARGALRAALRRLFLGYAPTAARTEATRLGLIEGRD
jgi:tRNA(Met) cytidine acetyltransferase